MSKSLEIGIIGLPNVGKSTLFNCLTNSNALIANYPFATIEPNTGIVEVPDDRLKILAKIYKTNKIIPATVKFIDIAGLVANASKGEGLGNQFLANIRSTDALVHVVRAFQDSNVIHVDSNPNPKNDIEIINTELVLADLNTVQKSLLKIEKEAKANPKLQPKLTEIKKAKTYLDNNQALHLQDDLDEDLLKDLNLLSIKRVIYVFNLDEESISNQQLQDNLSKIVKPSKAIFICAKLENELKDLDDEDKKEFLLSYSLQESGLNKLIKEAYDILGLQNYLTAGEKEVKAWTIRKGATAPQAAGAIHTDFERGFIAAEVIKFQDLATEESPANLRSKGLIKTEGKSYIVQPDDIIEFRFNV